jgi:hypothetical protein
MGSALPWIIWDFKYKRHFSSYFLLLACPGLSTEQARDQKKVTKKTQAFLTGLLLRLIISGTQKRI